MYSTDDVLLATRAIRRVLPALIGDEAEQMERDLNEVLEQSKTVSVEQILTILTRHSNTKRWIRKFLEEERTFERPIGPPGPVSGTTVIYFCENGHRWFPNQVGQPVPDLCFCSRPLYSIDSSDACGDDHAQ